MILNSGDFIYCVFSCILKWLMHLPLTMKEHFFNDSPKLSIWMLVEYQGHSNQTYALSQKGESLQSQ